MISPELEVILIAVITSLSCALLGTFLVLRKMSMISDAISHSILLGIVVAFFIVHDLASPFLLIGAALTGLLTVWMVEALQKLHLIKEDAAIGLVFPLLFSIGVILITRYAENVHLDIDAVLLGELAFAPFDRLDFFGMDLAKSLVVATAIFLINVLFVSLVYKELKILSFDPVFSASIGFGSAFIHYGLMTLVSLTAVGAFEAVGSILVVALFIAPPASAYLLTRSLSKMILMSLLIGTFNAVLGYCASKWLDLSIAGSIATLCGITFLLTMVFSPREGLISKFLRRKKQRIIFKTDMLLMHLSEHAGTEEMATESDIRNIPLHLNWNQTLFHHVLAQATHQGYLQQDGSLLILTEHGYERIQEMFAARSA